MRKVYKGGPMDALSPKAGRVKSMRFVSAMSYQLEEKKKRSGIIRCAR